MVSKFMKVRDF